MKKWLFFILIGVMLISTISGCTGKETNEEDKTSKDLANKSESTDNGKTVIEFPYTVEPIVFKGYSYEPLNNDLDTIAAKAWREHIGNISIEWEYAPFSDYGEKVKIYLASGEIPDVLPVENILDVINEYGSTGMILDFNKYSEHMPNPKKYREQYPSMDWLNTKDNKRFGITGVQPIDFAGESWFVNMDVLSKADVPAPNTLVELVDAVGAVKKADPDSIPFQSYWNIPYTQNWFARAIGAQNELIYYDTQAKAYKCSYREPLAKRKELIELMAMLYKEGLINPEIQSLSFEQEFNEISQGKWAFTAIYNRSLEGEIFKLAPGEELPYNIEPMTPQHRRWHTQASYCLPAR